MLVLRLGNVRLGRRRGDVCFRPRLHTIRKLSDVLLVCAFGHVRSVSIHHPLRGDLLGHQLCMWQQAFPECMDGRWALAVAYPLQMVVKSSSGWCITTDVSTLIVS